MKLTSKEGYDKFRNKPDIDTGKLNNFFIELQQNPV